MTVSYLSALQTQKESVDAVAETAAPEIVAETPEVTGKKFKKLVVDSFHRVLQFS